jgi:hypothetical protein
MRTAIQFSLENYKNAAREINFCFNNQIEEAFSGAPVATAKELTARGLSLENLPMLATTNPPVKCWERISLFKADCAARVAWIWGGTP